jgi:septal ring factor EnvC (AmiA/AmiB activator)
MRDLPAWESTRRFGGKLAAMPEQVKSASRPRGAGESDDRAALLEEIADQKEEILRLRDLLIAKDAELGAARGSLTELNQHSARLTVALRTLQARRIPALLRHFAARLRRRG